MLTLYTQSQTSGTDAFRYIPIIYMHDLYLVVYGGFGNMVHLAFMPIKQTEVN